MSSGMPETPRADHRQARGHRFGQHVRNPVGVAVGRDDTGHDHQRRFCHGLAHFGLRPRADERDAVGEAERIAQRFQARPFAAFADDDAFECNAAIAQRRQRRQQHVETLDRIESSDREQPVGQAAFAAELGFAEIERRVHDLDRNRAGLAHPAPHAERTLLRVIVTARFASASLSDIMWSSTKMSCARLVNENGLSSRRLRNQATLAG